ncbi:hypothetical protein [Flavobacterium sp. XS2P14]|uniref:hypothetical protein n=1 Tax=Flavobacterium sp. XS2P14 TaxID=3401735 RepID=UPI003AAE8328
MKKIITILFLISYINFNAQTIWKSSKYNYTIEIPKSFTKSISIGANVDFKANNGINSIVIVVTSIPTNYSSVAIWDILGDLKQYQTEWETSQREILNNPKMIKYGKTTIQGLDTFWYDFTTDDNILYSKTYQIKKNNRIYTITLSCSVKDYNEYSSIWFRFKDKLII